MAIADIARSEPDQLRKGPDCSVCKALAGELSEPEADALLAMLRDKSWRFKSIAARISADEDVPESVRNIQHNTYARHANGECAARVKLR